MAYFDFLEDGQEGPAKPKFPVPKVGEKLKIGGTEATVVDEPPQADAGTIMSADFSKSPSQEDMNEVSLQEQLHQGRKKVNALMSTWNPQDQTPQSEAQGKQIEGALKVLKTLEDYAKKAGDNALTAQPQQGAQASQPGALKTTPPVVADQPNQFVAKGGVRDLWGDFGLSESVMSDKMAKGMQALTKVIPGVTFGSPVSNFYAGLATVTRALGPNAVQGVFGKLMQEMQKPEHGYEKEAKRQEGLEAQSQQTQENDRVALKRASRELTQTDGLNSFGSIMLFVLTSMIIGPKLAILFFADKAKRGELQAEKNEIEMRMEANRRKSLMHSELAQASRMKAIGVNVEEKQMMKKELSDSWQRFTVERMRIKARSQQQDISSEQRGIMETAKKIEFSIGKDLRSATDLERDATEIERNVGDKNLVRAKRAQAAQLRERAELNMDRYHQFLSTHGLAAENDGPENEADE